MRFFFLNIITDKNNSWWALPLKLVLRILSWIYGVIVLMRNWFFDMGVLRSIDINRPVISVGNIVMGGTGKTPLVEYITKYLLSAGKKPVILTRGYTTQAGKACIGDEALMLAKKFESVPVLVGANRVDQAKRFLSQNNCDVFVMDDGFQRRQVKRNLNILVIDATNPFGNGALIPRGVLRESLGSIKRADIAFLMGNEVGDSNDTLESRIKKYNKGILLVKAAYQPVNIVDPISGNPMGLSLLEGKKVVSLSAIGRPEGFKNTIIALGVNVVGVCDFDDHHTYSQLDVLAVIKKAMEIGADAIVTTEKDIVKLTDFFGEFASKINIYVIGIETKIKSGAEELGERLNHIF